LNPSQNVLQLKFQFVTSIRITSSTEAGFPWLNTRMFDLSGSTADNGKKEAASLFHCEIHEKLVEFSSIL